MLLRNSFLAHSFSNSTGLSIQLYPTQVLLPTLNQSAFDRPLFVTQKSIIHIFSIAISHSYHEKEKVRVTLLNALRVAQICLHLASNY